MPDLLSPKEGIKKLLIDAAAISAVVGTKLFPSMAPQGENLPYGLYTRLADENDQHMGGASGLRRARIAVEWFGLEATQVEDLAAATETVLDNYEGPSEIEDRQVYFDLITKEEDEDGLVPPEDGKDAPIYTRRHTYEAWYRATE